MFNRACILILVFSVIWTAFAISHSYSRAREVAGRALNIEHEIAVMETFFACRHEVCV